MAIPFIAEDVELTEQILQEQERKFFAILDELMQKASEYKVTMRVLGSIAFRRKASKFKHIHYENQRHLNDFDFAAYSRDVTKIQDMFFDLGWQENQNVLRLFGDKRRIFFNPDQAIHADIFLDKLRFCHTIDLRQRLELDFPALSLIDLLLSKLQIVEINQRDLIDIMLLLRQYPVVHSEKKDAINIEYLAKICARNWGWWKTTQINLEKVLQFSDNFLEEEDAGIVVDKINAIKKAIQTKPKTLKWRFRDLIGEKMKWYEDVEEVQRG